MFKEDRDLPFSNGNYKVNMFGELLGLDNSIIPKIEINEEEYVDIQWFNGKGLYSLPLIVTVALWNIKIPTELWAQIEPIFHDGNRKNLTFNNLGYRFKNGCIEVSERPGFFYIPFYTKYCVDKDANVLNIKTGRQLVWSLWVGNKKKNVKGGYYYCTAVSDKTAKAGLMRHRAIGLTFIPCNVCFSKRVINHKNGTPGIDTINNLEWVTRKQNNIHAIQTGLILNRLKKILVKNIVTGEVTKYPSIAECERCLSLIPGILYKRLANPQLNQKTDNLLFKYDDGSEWPLIGDEIWYKNRRAIISRNVFTGDLTIFESILSAGEMLNILDESVISRSINSNVGTYPPIKGYDFQIYKHELKWPEYNFYDLAIIRESNSGITTGVLVKNHKGEEIAFYGSIKKAAVGLGISTISVYRACKTGPFVKALKEKSLSFYKFKQNN